MSKINKILREQLRIEEKSASLYNSFTKRIKDKKIKRVVAKIRDDEKEHARLVKKMISIAGLKA